MPLAPNRRRLPTVEAPGDDSTGAVLGDGVVRAIFPAISGVDRIQPWRSPRYDRAVDTSKALPVTESSPTPPASPDRPGVDAALAATIRKPLDALQSAADEAEAGMLGAAKLGLLVATNSLIEALEAVDAEFARRAASRAGPAGAERRPPSAPHRR
jgi:hypothetical protein